ncbi:MAG TPA: NADH-quinone oxidoreductase subunit N [Terriglobia bacterium]|nr:NADH-quinone oxidoreductase subunit N [Terriglobia bacterium]
MNIPEVNLYSILPVVVLSVFGIAIMVIEPFLSSRTRATSSAMGWLAFAGTIAAGAAIVPMHSHSGQAYSGLWIVDDFSTFFHVLFIGIAAMTTLLSIDYLRRENINHAEYYALLLFATAGMLVMAGSNELMMIFIGLEVLSIATYVMAGFRRTDLRSNESALKYFLLGSFASAFFLYGVALIFGATGSTNLISISAAMTRPDIQAGLVYLSAALLLTALCFKVAVAPFHIWTPDVYEGAPTPITGFMSVGPKAAGFAVLFRVFLTAYPVIEDRWTDVMGVLAALTMILGNLIAVVQPNLKRMLAYSSIAHAGYIAVAFAANSAQGGSAALFYTLAYTAMNLGAFAIVTVLGRAKDEKVQLGDYAGLASKRPGLAALLALFLLSLAGVPGTAGFAGKFFIFRAAVEANLTGLAVIGVITTVISFYYYLYVIVQMYMREPGEDFSDVVITPALIVVLLVAVGCTVYLGILPGRTLEWTAASALHVLN